MLSTRLNKSKDFTLLIFGEDFMSCKESPTQAKLWIDRPSVPREEIPRNGKKTPLEILH